jgi:hypothetical protein
MDGRRYSIIPIRASGLVKKGRTWRVLAALCSHSSRQGVCYPNQQTLSAMTGINQAHVSRAIRELYELGLLRYLLPIGKKPRGAFQRGNRYQILYEVNAPLPSEMEIEIAPGSRTGRW